MALNTWNVCQINSVGCVFKIVSITSIIFFAIYRAGFYSLSIFDDSRNNSNISKEGDNDIQHLWPLLLTWFNFNPSMDK